MGVAAHLGIAIREYDQRIRTFIPDYEEMLAAAAASVPARARTIIDLGTGTGALAAQCLRRAPEARVLGIDADQEILRVARRRLGARASFVARSFLHTALPRCDAVVASFALHHIRTRAAKAALYGRVRRALRRDGALVVVDCHPAADPVVARGQFDAWQRHLRRAYSPPKSAALLAAWALEDVYVPLDAELDLMRRSGFRVEVIWRKGSFAVLRGR
jgi:ubiquinone/menaquinone biosynthesis C-methylase UbiE